MMSCDRAFILVLSALPMHTGCRYEDQLHFPLVFASRQWLAPKDTPRFPEMPQLGRSCGVSFATRHAVRRGAIETTNGVISLRNQVILIG